MARRFFWIFVNSVNRLFVDTSEPEIVDRAAAGDRDARRTLFERFREPAYRVALRITGRPEDALDVLRARRVRVAVPLAGDDEDRRPEPVATDRATVPGHDLERGELAERLRRAIEALPPDQRAVFALYATGDVTYGEIAEMLGVPIGTVMSRLYHARRRLHDMLPDLAPVTRNGENS